MSSESSSALLNSLRAEGYKFTENSFYQLSSELNTHNSNDVCVANI